MKEIKYPQTEKHTTQIAFFGQKFAEFQSKTVQKMLIWNKM